MRLRGGEPAVATLPLPAVGAERAARDRTGAPGASGDKGRDTRSPPPALVRLLSFVRGNLSVPPHPSSGLCPAASLDVPSDLAGPPAAPAASVGLVLRSLLVERAGSRGLRLPVFTRSPTLSPAPLPDPSSP